MAEKGGVYVLDEPTTGLHLADVEQLLGLLDRLVDSGKSVIVIEHHQAVMAHADWIIDLGPGAGHDGGRIVFEGTPADLVAARSTLTGEHLAAYVGARTRWDWPPHVDDTPVPVAQPSSSDDAWASCHPLDDGSPRRSPARSRTADRAGKGSHEGRGKDLHKEIKKWQQRRTRSNLGRRIDLSCEVVGLDHADRQARIVESDGPGPAAHRRVDHRGTDPHQRPTAQR